MGEGSAKKPTKRRAVSASMPLPEKPSVKAETRSPSKVTRATHRLSEGAGYVASEAAAEEDFPQSKSYEELRRPAVQAALGIEFEDEVEFAEEEWEAQAPRDGQPPEAAEADADADADEPEEDLPAYIPQLRPAEDGEEPVAAAPDIPENLPSQVSPDVGVEADAPDAPDASDVPDGVAFVPDGPARPSVGAGARVITPEFPQTRRSRRGARILGGILIFLILAALLTLIGFLSKERWYTYDDPSDFRGTWVIRGEAAHGHEVATITITDKKIILDKDTTYLYTLDTRSKIITYTFQDLEGSGHYRFSADRNWLIIEDGNYNWLTTTASDFWWQLRSWWATWTHTSQPPLGPTSDVTLLLRVEG